MADNVTLNAMTGGATVGADEVTDGTLGTVKVQYVKLMDGTLDGTTKGVIDSTYGLKVDVARTVNVVLAAGTNAIGKLAANSGVDIGDVDVTSVVPGTAATNLGKAEDAAHASGDTGVMALAVRNDAAATSLSGTDGDYTPVAVDAKGRQFVVERGATIDSTSVSVTTSNTAVVAAATDRRSVTVQNLGTDYVYLGKTGVAANTGVRLAPGQTFVLDKSPNAALYGLAASGTQTVSIFTESD